MIAVTPVANCPVCRASERRIVYTAVPDRLFGAEGEWTFAECRGCGLLFLDPRPADADIAKTYTVRYSRRKTFAGPTPVATGASYRQSIKHTFFTRFYGYPARSRRGGRLLAFIPLLVPAVRRTLEDGILSLRFVPEGRLLDVGCGNGTFVHHMRGLGWAAEGIDTDPELVAACRSRGLNVRLGSLEAQAYPDEHFDVVVLKHLIEHVPDPVRLLRECRRVLKPSGGLLVLTPNAESWARSVFEEYWLGLDPSRHMQVFSSRTLSLIASHAGFEIADVRSTARITRFVWLASHLLKSRNASVYEVRPNISERARAALFSFRVSIALALGRTAGDELRLWAVKE